MLHIDGQEKQWDEVFGFIWCASRRATAYRPVEYCFGKDENRLNPWGCKQAQTDWTDWANWFCYGKWEKSSIRGQKIQWRFDKERIKHELATNLYRFRFCPHLKTEMSRAVLRHLPDIVLPESDPNWDFHEIYEGTPGAIKIVRKERSEIVTISSEFWSNGVRPKGLRILTDILLKAFHDLGISPATVKALL